MLSCAVSKESGSHSGGRKHGKHGGKSGKSAKSHSGRKTIELSARTIIGDVMKLLKWIQGPVGLSPHKIARVFFCTASTNKIHPGCKTRGLILVRQEPRLSSLSAGSSESGELGLVHSIHHRLFGSKAHSGTPPLGKCVRTWFVRFPGLL